MLVTEATVENVLPIGTFLSARLHFKSTCIALKYVPVTWQDFYYFEYLDSYFCVVESIKSGFQC